MYAGIFCADYSVESRAVWGISMRNYVAGSLKSPIKEGTARRMNRWGFAGARIESTCSRSTGARLIRTAMMSSARWRETLTYRGKGAAIRCPGNMPARKCGCESTAARWKSAMAPSGSPCTVKRPVGNRLSRKTSTTQAFQWVIRAQAKRSSTFNRAHRSLSSDRWKPMRAWRWEARDEYSRKLANYSGRTQLDGHRCASGSPVGKRFQEGAGLRRLPAGGNEHGS